MLLNQAQIAELYYPWQPDDMRASLAEHRRLLGALSQGDLTRSEAELAEHWRHSRARVREQFSDFLRNDHQSAPSSDGVATQRPTADNAR
jgi:DNA-binding GntR family transcriptional regulator